MLRSFTYPGEGWGITNDGKQIYMSDGTSQIRVWDPSSLKEIRRINVTDGGNPVTALNELEFVRGEIFANVWQTTGSRGFRRRTAGSLGWIDLTGLLAKAERPDPEPFSTASLMTAPATAFSLPGSSGRKFSRSDSFPKK